MKATFDKIQAAIDFWLANEGDNSRLMAVKPELEQLWQLYSDQEKDYRPGSETYGYGDDVYEDMVYISDRWKCAFRLKWIIDGLENRSI